ncbi:VWA domain-containing protein [Terriglobus aquaticus]|uniref:VWA domain-containing protein n=1 Tax=Terriglobus aquaticus TaxID=940139 RepID=A0ABW9KNB7_9BACT|nr:VWA domain-containing protein [Terriglobus aquaticus]
MILRPEPQTASTRFSRLRAVSFAAVLCTASLFAGAAQAQVPALPPSTADTAPAKQAPATAQVPASAAPAPTQAAPTQAAPTQAAPQAAAAQQQPDADVAAPTIRAFVPEVSLIFTVTDKKGRFVTGLQQQNFGLLDDGRRPDRVIRFTQQANLPLRIGIMLDTSNSIRSRFQFEQDAASEFLLQVLRRGDAAFVTGFDVRTELAQDYTNNIDLLNQAIHKLRPGGGTAFFDALYSTCRDQMLTVQGGREDIRKAIVLVSDGEDNYSHAYEQDAIKECQRAETIVYTISTNVSPSRDKGDEVLERISDATGGHTFFPNKIEDVAKGFQSIEEELRSQYSLRYRPADFKQDGAFRTIRLVAMDPRYNVRAKKGYFAPRPQ